MVPNPIISQIYFSGLYVLEILYIFLINAKTEGKNGEITSKNILFKIRYLNNVTVNFVCLNLMNC